MDINKVSVCHILTLFYFEHIELLINSLGIMPEIDGKKSGRSTPVKHAGIFKIDIFFNLAQIMFREEVRNDV